MFGLIESLLLIIWVIVLIVPFLLAAGAGAQGNWGAMFILLAIGLAIMFLSQAIGL